MIAGVTLRNVLRECEERLREAGVASARAEAEWLLASLLGASRTELYLRDEPLEEAAVAAARERLSRRVRGESLQYILGEAWCAGVRLSVPPGVFIPRPETETLIEQAIAFLRARAGGPPGRGLWALELGLGSGAIAIALSRAVPSCAIVGLELSWMALQAAAANAAAHDARRRIHPVCGDGLDAVRGRFDLVISNPPYLPSAEADELLARPGAGSRRAGAAGLDDPRASLDGGPDGMRHHRHLIEAAPRLLAGDGALCVECAEDQATVLAALLAGEAWAAGVRVLRDLTGRARGVWAERRSL